MKQGTRITNYELMDSSTRVAYPEEVDHLLRNCGAALAVSISGGKDSQVMLREMVTIRQMLDLDVDDNGGKFFAVHADLGRMEWKESLSECQRHCKRTNGINTPLVVVRRPQGDLLQQMQDRMKKLEGTGKPFWPSSAARYCTSDQKRGQIDKVLRKYEIVISAEGIRAEESPARSKLPVIGIRKQITAERLREMTVEQAIKERQPGERLAVTWRPILYWQAQYHVWVQLGGKDLAHPAYRFGNDRVSCAFCVMASANDLSVGARHNPELFETLCKMEDESGCSFQNKRWLRDISSRISRESILQPPLFTCI